MSRLYLYDDATARGFEPFALTRPVSELRAGIAVIRRRWERVLGVRAAGFVGAPHLAGFEELDAPPAVERGAVLPAGSVVANSRCVVALADAAGDADAWRCDGRVAAVRLREDVPAERLADGALPLDALAEGARGCADVAGHWLGAVWDLVGQLGAQLADDIPRAAATLTTAESGATVLGTHPVYVEEGATVEPFVVLDASAGPILVRRGATVQSFARVFGPSYVGEGSTVMGEVRGCSIGDVCKVRGEISASVVLGHSNKGHEGFVGHSYLGRWVNLGAGTTTSNLKNTYGTVALWTPEGVRDTREQFLGTLFGDHAKTGIGLRLTTGTVLGAGANVYDAMPPKAVPPFAWGGGAPYDEYALDKFLEVAARAMARRHVELGAGPRRQLAAAHARAAEQRGRWLATDARARG
jgi:UDP-N-acetylglucosamine diphosphorylase/glucosamine-1-phosphate N-acetyltransferase